MIDLARKAYEAGLVSDQYIINNSKTSRGRQRAFQYLNGYDLQKPCIEQKEEWK